MRLNEFSREVVDEMIRAAVNKFPDNQQIQLTYAAYLDGCSKDGFGWRWLVNRRKIPEVNLLNDYFWYAHDGLRLLSPIRKSLPRTLDIFEEHKRYSSTYKTYFDAMNAAAQSLVRFR